LAVFFSICAEMMYPKIKVEKRAAKVAQHGFTYTDIWDWRTKDLDELERELKRTGVKLNAFGGHRDTSTSKASEKAGFLSELRASLKVAERFECEHLIVFSDGLRPPIVGTDPPVIPAKLNQISEGEKMRNMADAFADAVELAERSDVTLLIEALNEIDHPDYFLSRSKLTFELIRKVRSKRFKMLYDVYHMQRSEGDVIHTLTENLDQVGYIHFADSPQRSEPGTGELYLQNILKALQDHNYARGFGFEYRSIAADDKTLVDVAKIVSPYMR
jgi:hydroxypyruvate isomerase